MSLQLALVLGVAVILSAIECPGVEKITDITMVAPNRIEGVRFSAGSYARWRATKL